MNIIVTIKQVPDSQNVKIDPNTGVLIRDGIESIMNPFDLYALEAALLIKEKIDSKVIVISMGPPSANEILYEALAMGADEAYLLTDRKFSGADVLATSYTLSKGIEKIGNYDLIICGKQTTDGDTAQVGPALSEWLKIPHVSWCKEIIDFNDKEIIVSQQTTNELLELKMSYPCLITIEKDAYQPRLPSYLLKKKNKDKIINQITFDDLNDDEKNYGLNGSATQVEKIFEPSHNNESLILEGKDSVETLYKILKEKKLIED